MPPTPIPEPNEEQVSLQAQLLNVVEQAILAVDLTGRIVFWNRFAEKLYGWPIDQVQGRNIDEVLAAPLLMEAARANMGQLRQGEGWSGEFLVERQDGTTFRVHVSASLVQSERRTLISIIGTSRDSAARQQLPEANRWPNKARPYRESQRPNAEPEQRSSERTAELQAVVAQLKQSEATIQTLFRISTKLNSTLDVDTILDELAQEAIRIVNGESGFAGLRTVAGMTVRKYFRQDTAMPFDYTWPLGRGIPGWVLQHKVPYGTSDAAHDPMMQHELAINTDVRSIICTPILSSSGEVLGYFDIRNKQDAEGFTISDQDMLMALAPAASIAIQNALAYQQRLSAEAELHESYERLRALAAKLESVREEERTQIARELHDQLGQALTAMKFDLAWLTDRLVQKDATLAHKAKAVTSQMDAMIKTVRRIATELRPGMLDDLGLAASIEWQARDFEKRTGIACEVTVSAQDLPLTRAQALALFRISQEALTNVARHANAQHIEVQLAATLETATLQVHDDGRGIQASKIAGRNSLGLLGMRERAQRLGGTFDIQSVLGDGTLVTVSIPLKSNDVS